MNVGVTPPASDSGSPILRYTIMATPAAGASVGVGGTLGQPVPGTNRVGGARLDNSPNAICIAGGPAISHPALLPRLACRSACSPSSLGSSKHPPVMASPLLPPTRFARAAAAPASSSALVPRELNGQQQLRAPLSTVWRRKAEMCSLASPLLQALAAAHSQAAAAATTAHLETATGHAPPQPSTHAPAPPTSGHVSSANSGIARGC